MQSTVARAQMVKKRYAVAYWLVPEEAAHEVFSTVIRQLARRFQGPIFEPHLTAFVGPENARCPADTLRQVGSVTIELTILSIRFSDQFTKTLFVQFERNAALQKLGDKIWKASGARTRYIIDPHLSLLYASLTAKKKTVLVDEIKVPFRRVSFSSICAMRCARPTTTAAAVEQWRRLAP